MVERRFVIVPYSPDWPARFRELAERIRTAMGPQALRIDHIGSTAVAGLCSKNVIDIQITVADVHDPESISTLVRAGFILRENPVRDHVPPGQRDNAGDWDKRYLREPAGMAAAHVHVRPAGKPNQRYALLFRDYLRAHPAAAAAYAQIKLGLAPRLERDDYIEIKDAVCDLIMQSAELWAKDGWSIGLADA